MKQATFFIAGAVCAEFAILFTLHHPVTQILIGFAIALTSVIALVWLLGARRTSRLLIAFADAWAPQRARQNSIAIVPQPSRLEQDLVSALISQGARESSARKAAAAAAKYDQDFDSAFRMALELLPKGRKA